MNGAGAEDRLATIRAASRKKACLRKSIGFFRLMRFQSTRNSSPISITGHRLFVFQRACNQLYQLSVKGKQPGWVARYLDAGKPSELIEFSRRKESATICRESFGRISFY